MWIIEAQTNGSWGILLVKKLVFIPHLLSSAHLRKKLKIIQGNELAAPSPFLEQSYITTHLLQQVISKKMPEDASVAHATLLSTNNWKNANQQYFKCLAMMQQLRQISLKFNKDLGLEEVSLPSSINVLSDYSIKLAFIVWKFAG